MDTVWSIKSDKCKQCYACVRACSFVNKDNGFLGFLTISARGNVWFNGESYGCSCHHCGARILRDENGKLTAILGKDAEEDENAIEIKGYLCNHICPNDAMDITRW